METGVTLFLEEKFQRGLHSLIATSATPQLPIAAGIGDSATRIGNSAAGIGNSAAGISDSAAEIDNNAASAIMP